MKVIEKEAETENIKAKIDAQKVAEVAKIHATVSVLEKKAQQKIQTVQDQILVAKQQALADAEFYKRQKLAESNSMMLTPEYIMNEVFKELRHQPKLFFGDSLLEFFNTQLLNSALFFATLNIKGFPTVIIMLIIGGGIFESIIYVLVSLIIVFEDRKLYFFLLGLIIIGQVIEAICIWKESFQSLRKKEEKYSGAACWCFGIALKLLWYSNKSALIAVILFGYQWPFL